MASSHTAVLLMAYGSPNRLEDVEAYFTDIRVGRTPTRQAVEELTARYRRVGVPTPLLAVSMELGRELERLLNIDPPDDRMYTVHVGMKHWTPRIPTAIDEIVDSGADHVIAIVLAPHFSTISTGGYRRQVDQALAAARDGAPSPSLDFVASWHELDGYLEALAENVRMGRAGFANPSEVVAVFTAHSLPARILGEGDPYQDQLLRPAGRHRSVALLVPEPESHRGALARARPGRDNRRARGPGSPLDPGGLSRVHRRPPRDLL